MSSEVDIYTRLQELESEGFVIIEKMRDLKVLYREGYRVVDENDQPIKKEGNVVNIAEYRK